MSVGVQQGLQPKTIESVSVRQLCQMIMGGDVVGAFLRLHPPDHLVAQVRDPQN